MSVELNHTIVPARDPEVSAHFLAGVLGLDVDPPLAHFTPVRLSNRVTLDYDRAERFEPHHYAFMVGEREFDAAFARIRDGGITHYADPACREAGRIYESRQVPGRRGTYFRDPDGHLMEILTPGDTERR
ncbi:VOC family protein [Streptomyces drozdowiczii]|uniref:VOC family protein n=1 Tax=Streptomyces drozdowiczii TaxID=202862 RepID=A0ABY6PU09_9ACTN|nr:VOC family protein [Streptomyces drozdowiczii]MCX0244740.1 VOC family protein [Streptomyces drozdowiczii]UZK55527.1 VOC family protein [Streptomyces drozdowiczii]